MYCLTQNGVTKKSLLEKKAFLSNRGIVGDRLEGGNMRTCAVCSKQISHADLCKKCTEEWGNGGNFPDWLVELVAIQKHFECRGSANDENLTDLGLDLAEEE